MSDILKPENSIEHDPWSALKNFTAARIALGRTGISIPLKESLQFKMAHAHARDAVYTPLDTIALTSSLEQSGLDVIHVKSKASSRPEYLQRPDLGRVLRDESVNILSTQPAEGSDMVFIIADGLSSLAVQTHAVPLVEKVMKKLQPSHFRFSPVVLVEQGRVAISDEIGFILKASLAVILIGERPGLSSPDSLGAYLTYTPKPGLTDHARNCVSNIRPEGLNYDEASEKIAWLIRESLRRKISGVGLKEENPGLILPE